MEKESEKREKHIKQNYSPEYKLHEITLNEKLCKGQTNIHRNGMRRLMSFEKHDILS